MTKLFNKDGFVDKIERLKENYSRHDDIMKDLMEKWIIVVGRNCHRCESEDFNTKKPPKPALLVRRIRDRRIPPQSMR